MKGAQRLNLQQFVCVCNDPNQAAMLASPGIPLLQSTCVAGLGTELMSPQRAITVSPHPPLHVTNFQSHFLVQLDWFILVLHFVPHIQLFHSPVLLVFYKNINFSKAEKRERYILIYKRKKAKSDISLYS